MKAKTKYIILHLIITFLIILSISYNYSVTEFDIWILNYFLINSIWLIWLVFTFIVSIFFIPTEFILTFISWFWALLNFFIYICILSFIFNKKKNYLWYFITLIFIVINLAIWFWLFL